MSYVIEVNNVHKRFLLGSGSIKSMLLDRKENRKREFWALKDVSFAVEQGTALGIVGHNGSGKSTMLKLLTGILEPTLGTITTQGRIGALIEVGAGFHPDLTGRENVYLNGSILGLSEREIARRFDAIVEFAGLEQFIDTPVKRYSSGMYMRLGFSIAAHIDPEIMIIDEVLAVGDQQFQNKCMRHMKEFLAQGGTLVFVSHAMNQVAQLCEQCVWLDHGQLFYQGVTKEAVDRYMTLVAEREREEFKRKHPEEWAIMQKERRRTEGNENEQEDLSDPDQSRIVGVTLLDGNGNPQTNFHVGEPMQVRIHYRFAQRLPNPVFTLEILRQDDLYMFATNTHQHGLALGNLPLEGHITMDVPFMSLNEGDFRIRLQLFPNCENDSFYLEFPVEHRIENAAKFHVSAGRFGYGCTYLPVQWGVGALDSSLVTGKV